MSARLRVFSEHCLSSAYARACASIVFWLCSSWSLHSSVALVSVCTRSSASSHLWLAASSSFSSPSRACSASESCSAAPSTCFCSASTSSLSLSFSFSISSLCLLALSVMLMASAAQRAWASSYEARCRSSCARASSLALPSLSVYALDSWSFCVRRSTFLLASSRWRNASLTALLLVASSSLIRSLSLSSSPLHASIIPAVCSCCCFSFISACAWILIVSLASLSRVWLRFTSSRSS
mmetsp:Transcript_2733/g.6724  ORF Transcript_2733/g.6724 Transcript_2733/m.6724 type:complete len:238 (-) Transcript_2733:813-1526(-)